eukprot:1192303-Prorocentrum_minimum.AAC.2
MGIYLRGDQSQGSRRVYTCVGTDHRGVNGYIPAWGPITWESTGIHLRGDQSHGSRRVYTCVGTNHMGVDGFIPAWGPITRESTGIYLRGDQSQGSQPLTGVVVGVVMHVGVDGAVLHRLVCTHVRQLVSARAH